MLSTIINILTILLCIGLLFQDFRERRISVWILATLFLLLFTGKASFEFQHMLMNISYIILLYLLLTLYFSIKEKRFVNIIDSYIGLGDFLFLLAITPAFSFPAFILFTTAGLFFSLLVYVLFFMLMKKQSHREIPLAGMLSGLLIVATITSTINPEISFNNNEWLITFLNLSEWMPSAQPVISNL